MARVQISSWRETYSGIVPESYLDAMDHGAYEERWRGWLEELPENRVFYVAEEDKLNSVVGFASGGPGREPPREDFDCELYTIYLMPGSSGKGVGRRLVRAVAGDLHAGGFRRMYCWVMAENLNARHFYGRLGGVEVGDHIFEVQGARIVEVACAWEDLRELCTNL